MAFTPFFGRRDNFWDVADPMVVFDNHRPPANSYARDAHAVESTSVDWKETPTEHDSS
jgi:hypothetical protein